MSWTVIGILVPSFDASATFDSTAGSALQVQTLQIGSAAAPTVQAASGCTTVTVSWTRVDAANNYAVQFQEGSGPWTDLSTSTGDVTEVVDTVGHTATSVRYRVAARHVSSGWIGPSSTASAAVSC